MADTLVVLLDGIPPIKPQRKGLIWIIEQIATADREPCWEYPYHRDPNGYGCLSWNGKHDRAHRVAWRLAHQDELPAKRNMVVMHKCDNPPCCNPAHLKLGRQRTNARQAVKRGLHNPVRGEAHVSAKLTEQMVREIRAIDDDQYYLAELYGVSQATISEIKRRKIWKHVA
jgi:hypothetical protein